MDNAIRRCVMAIPYTNTFLDIYREPEDIPVEDRGDSTKYALVHEGIPGYVSYVTGASDNTPGNRETVQGVRIIAVLTNVQRDDRVHDTVTDRWYKVDWALNRSNSLEPRSSFTAIELET